VNTCLTGDPPEWIVTSPDDEWLDDRLQPADLPRHGYRPASRVGSYQLWQREVRGRAR
jgi:hypothetical protein